jgi:hypothetical protein
VENVNNLTGHTAIEVPNAPLGAKHNAALALVPKDADAVVILPSDDFIHPSYLFEALELIAGGVDYVFPATCGMYEVATVRDADGAEVKWIARYRKKGCDLLNMNSGGQAMEQCARSPLANTKVTGAV